MSYETVQTLLLLLLALIVGAFLGCVCRRWMAPKPAEAASDATTPADVKSTVNAEISMPQAASVDFLKDANDSNVATTRSAAVSPPQAPSQDEITLASIPVRARGLNAPIGGVADDLKAIKGVGPKLESTLNGLGIYHFEQVAGWTNQDVEEVDDLLSFKGRIVRDDWIEQAKVLMRES